MLYLYIVITVQILQLASVIYFYKEQFWNKKKIQQKASNIILVLISVESFYTLQHLVFQIKLCLFNLSFK